MAMLYMSSLEIQRDFLDTGLEADKTLFVCASLTLDLNPQDSRVIRIKEFVPSAELCGLYDASQYDAFRTKYAQYIQHAPLRATLATLAKYCIDDEKNVVFVCSVNEAQFDYLGIISDYMGLVMDYRVYNVKDYIKAMKKNKVESNFNSETIKKVDEVLAKCKMEEPEIEKIVDFIINGSHYEAERAAKEERKRREKQKKKEKKRRKKKDLLFDDLDLLSGGRGWEE